MFDPIAHTKLRFWVSWILYKLLKKGHLYLIKTVPSIYIINIR